MQANKLKIIILLLASLTICFASLPGNWGIQSVQAENKIMEFKDASDQIVLHSFRYPSTIDKIDNLYAHYAYDASKKNLPIVVLMHGYTQDSTSMTDWIMKDMANYGFFAVAVGMRGRDQAEGTMDVNGRELYDIIDAVEYVKKNFSSYVDPANINVSGYSGGGGNAFGLAAKFPDTFNVLVSHFGLADYGYDKNNSWWATSKTRQASIKQYLGDTPQSNKAKYYSRAHQYGIGQNLQGGFLYMFHDAEDNNVQPVQSKMVKEQMDLHKHSNYSFNLSKKGDAIRWLHASPDQDQQVRLSRDIWGQAVLTKKYPQWTIAEKGKVLVQGYIKTKRFSIWLDDGTEEVADITYDASSGTYIVKPLTGLMKVSIT